MVLSWLTATNNSGHFIFSIHKKRYTAPFFLSNKKDFVLCVPTVEQRELVLAIGSTSGKFGSKLDRSEGDTTIDDASQVVRLSQRQRRKLNQDHWNQFGIPGLHAQCLFEEDNESGGVFGVHGTVAHLRCRVLRILPKDTGEDDAHHLIQAQVVDAYCRSDYWEPQKQIFAPSLVTTPPPYLTFLGSQTFGKVVRLDD